MVEALNACEVVVAATVTLDVDSHSLKHFELMTTAVDFKYLSVVLLEEASNWQQVFLRIGHAQVLSIVGLLEEVYIVIFVPFLQATVKIFVVPLSVYLLSQIFGVATDVSIITTDQDYTVWVDEILELRL